MICEELERQGLHSFVTVETQANGEGDDTYPEPRQIYLHYKSVFDKELTYLRPDVVLEKPVRVHCLNRLSRYELKVSSERIFLLHHWQIVSYMRHSRKDIS